MSRNSSSQILLLFILLSFIATVSCARKRNVSRYSWEGCAAEFFEILDNDPCKESKGFKRANSNFIDLTSLEGSDAS